MKTWTIYKITNPKTQLAYIGLTSNIKTRIQTHKRNHTIKCTNFTTEILLDDIPSLAEANEMEKVFIDLHGTFENGANETRGGGRNTEVSETTRKNQSERMKGNTNPSKRADVREKQSKAHTGKKKKPHSEKRRQELSKAWTGENNPSKRADVREKHSERIKGDKNPAKRPEVRAKLSGDNHWKRRKRLKAEWMYIRSLARLLYESQL